MAVFLLNVFLALSVTLISCSIPSQGLTTEEVEEIFLNEVNRTKIREYHRYLTLHPHVSGTVHNERIANYLVEKWTEFGFDSVDKATYNVLLSYPDRERPNIVQMLDGNGLVIFTSQLNETTLLPEDEHPDFPLVYNSFSPNGTVEGELVYANYARPQDFEALRAIGVNFTDTIVIARYGENYRGNKVNLAAQYGAKGIILFNDPFYYAQEGEDPENVYPNNKWLPGTGAQRGSVKTLRGDTLTPNYPALQDVYRFDAKDVPLPKIPCQPIGYEDAKELIRALGGFTAPMKWQLNISVGPGFASGIPAKKVRLIVNNQLIMRNISNIIGIIKGSVEPDRYIMAGNHYDAWGFGAVDASSGTAQMIEVTRIFGQLLERGWRPRRTIVFCAWDAEEMGLIGSYEFVEDRLVKLQNRGAVYINTDSCSAGDLFIPNASPFLKQYLIESTKKVPSPSNESLSLYQHWYQQQLALGQLNSRDEIIVSDMRGGTDHVAFFAYAGVTTIHMFFGANKLKHRRPFSGYPAYHTAYDTFHLVDNYIDPGNKFMSACSSLNLFLIHDLSESELLPFNMSSYRNSIEQAFNSLHRDKIWEYMQNSNKTLRLDHFNSSVQNFVNATREWEERMKNFTSTNPLKIRAVNDQLMLLDKAFLNPKGIPLQTQYRHMVFALSLHNMYGASTFPGIRDLIHEIKTHPVEDDPRWVELEKHISDIIIAFHAAVNVLKPIYII